MYFFILESFFLLLQIIFLFINQIIFYINILIIIIQMCNARFRFKSQSMRIINYNLIALFEFALFYYKYY